MWWRRRPAIPSVHVPSLRLPGRPSASGTPLPTAAAPDLTEANLPPADSRPSAPVKEPKPARSGARPQYQCVVLSLEFTIK